MSLIIDLHGMSDSHGIDLCVGLGRHPGGLAIEASQVIQNAFAGYRVTENYPFSAQADYTLTSFVQREHMTECIQVEIGAAYRDPSSAPAAASGLIERFVASLAEINRLTVPVQTRPISQQRRDK
ncbi:hypothetical protein [Diaminobutyricimonas sp. TR449]|uniref:hypothetical protein n=1 Tax=Diaminobutyricimonas sp. TR449 TaxID=2708076 RepID=UPI0014211316|nr:hypothetical protein [Diaminobutyricimonas sp. TR449]